MRSFELGGERCSFVYDDFEGDAGVCVEKVTVEAPHALDTLSPQPRISKRTAECRPRQLFNLYKWNPLSAWLESTTVNLDTCKSQGCQSKVNGGESWRTIVKILAA